MDEGFLHVVDAADGTVLFRQNLVAHDHGQVWRNYPGAPAGGTQQNVNLNKWLPLERAASWPATSRTSTPT